MYSKQLIVSIIVWAIVGIANVTYTLEAKPECWSASECLINSTRISLKSPSHKPISTIYNCTIERKNDPISPPKHCESNFNVTLDGCHVDRASTIGTEYIEAPDCVQSLIIENFPAARIGSAFNDFNFTRLTELILRYNAISAINGNSFHGLESLTHLEIRNNSLETIANETFDGMHKLNSLTIIDPALRILRNLSFGNVLEYVHIDVKSIEWPHLPDSLIELKMINTIMLVNAAHEFILFENMYQLRSVSMCFCNLTVFPMITSNTMETLNFTDNTLNTFVAHKLLNLVTFDISRNKLPRVTSLMLGEMKKLETFLAADNVIETVSDQAFINNTNLKHIDLTNNRLRELDIRFPVVSSPPQRILVNGNPWSCDWLSKAASDQHHLFVCFEYESLTTGDNVLGLQCIKKHDSSNNTQSTNTSEPSSHSASETPATTTSAATTTIIAVLSVALACTIILSIILYAKHRRHSQPFRPQRVDERGNFLNLLLRRRGEAEPEAEEADNAADDEGFERALHNHSDENR